MSRYLTVLLSFLALISFSSLAEEQDKKQLSRSEGSYLFLHTDTSTTGISNHSTNESHPKHVDDVWFHNSAITLTHDADNDGYYSRIKVAFDLDTHFSSIEVYAALILIDSQNHETEYFVTNDFWLYGNSAIDDYKIKTLLEENWHSDYYRLRVEIYDADDGTFLTAIDDYDDSSFDNLPLESVDYDINYNNQFSFHEVSVDLIKDADNDGFYQTFSLNLDADNSGSSRQVQAKIFIKSTSNSWRELFTSQTFTLSGSSSNDLQHWTFDMLNGYRADRYQLKVELYDANDDSLLLATNSSDFPQLQQLKFEDASNDTQSNTPQPPKNNDNKKSSSSGSGSMNLFTLVLLFGLLGRRYLGS